MKYHYRITRGNRTIHNSATQGTIVDSTFTSASIARSKGEEYIRTNLDSKMSGEYVLNVKPYAETVEEEDQLEGHPYPAHETWPDIEEFDYSILHLL